uniref:Putative secreted protein n=1 Tax=Anopheles marajoara TaxID=58244 RepID=A0A2M4C8Q1_9DIPT
MTFRYAFFAIFRFVFVACKLCQAIYRTYTASCVILVGSGGVTVARRAGMIHLCVVKGYRMEMLVVWRDRGMEALDSLLRLPYPTRPYWQDPLSRSSRDGNFRANGNNSSTGMA